MILLSKDPNKALRFLGYGEDLIAKYWRSFDTPEDMFNFVMECRFFCVRSNQETEADGQDVPCDATQLLHKGDRKRLAMRGLYRKWVEEFLPKAIEDGMCREPVHTREGVQQLAFESFGVEKEYR